MVACSKKTYYGGCSQRVPRQLFTLSAVGCMLPPARSGDSAPFPCRFLIRPKNGTRRRRGRPSFLGKETKGFLPTESSASWAMYCTTQRKVRRERHGEGISINVGRIGGRGTNDVRRELKLLQAETPTVQQPHPSPKRKEGKKKEPFFLCPTQPGPP